MGRTRMITTGDSNYRRGMNSLDDPKALADGECAELVNLLPGYPLRPRMGSVVTPLGSTLGNYTLESKPYYAVFKMDSGGNGEYLFYVIRLASGEYKLRYTNAKNLGASDVVAEIDFSAIHPARVSFQMVDGVLYMTVMFSYGASINSMMFAIENSGGGFVGRKIPGPTDIQSYAAHCNRNNTPGSSDVGTLYGYSYTLVRRKDVPATDTSTAYVPGLIETPEDVNKRLCVESYAYYANELSLPLASGDRAVLSGQYGFTHIRWYRTRNLRGAFDASSDIIKDQGTAAFVKGADRYFLMDAPLGELRVIDDIPDGDLSGEMNQLTSFNYTMPPPVGRDIVYFKDRLFMSANDGRVFFSEIPGGDGGGDVGFAQDEKTKFALWFKPTDYRLDLDIEEGVPVTGMASLGDDLYLFKQSRVYSIAGGDPMSAPLRVIADNVGCPYPDAITKCVINDQEALFFLSGAGPMLITEGGRVTPLNEFKIAGLWPDKGLNKNGDYAASFWNNMLLVSGASAVVGAGRMFGYASSGEDVGAFVVETSAGYSIKGQAMVTIDGKALFVGQMGNSAAAVDFMGAGASEDRLSSGTIYPVAVRFRSRKLYPGPEERSVSELYQLTWYCYFRSITSALWIAVKSNRSQTEMNYNSSAAVFQSAYPSSKDAVQRSVDFVPKAGFIGEYFQYELRTQVRGGGTLDFYGTSLECIPRPQLEVESLVGGGDVIPTW